MPLQASKDAHPFRSRHLGFGPNTRGTLAAAIGLIACLVLIGTAPAAMAYPVYPRMLQAADGEPVIPDGAMAPSGSAKIVMPLRDNPKERIVGKVIWFDLKQLSYVDKDDAQTEIEWTKLSAEHLPRFINLLPDKRDAQSCLLAAELLIDHGGTERMVERMFGYALKSDKDAKDRVEQLREKMNNPDPANAPDQGDGEVPGDGEKPAGNNPPEIDNPRAWPVMTKEQHDAVIEDLKKSTDDVLKKMNHKMGNTQTERFLVYSDMSAKESKYWVGLLDKMYDKLCGVFDLDKDVNIWRGKCLLLFFNSEADFLKYNAAAYGNNVTGAAGICYQFGTGDVHISMYKQRDEKDLAHVLVHEAVHGFLFRYQSSHHVPNWLNEGLAEFIAVSLVNSGEYPARAMSSRQFVKQRRSYDNFLSARNIIGQHYGLAFDVTDMMVNENRKGYVKLIQGIKEGLTLDEAFDQKYGASIDKIFDYYGRTRLKADNIKLR